MISVFLISGCEIGTEPGTEEPGQPEEPQEPEEPPQAEFCGESTLDQCSADTDCMVDGCNGEICRGVNAGGFSSICQWLDCYAEKVNFDCKCHDSQCQWVAK